MWNRPAEEPFCAWLRVACARRFSISLGAKPARAAPQMSAPAKPKKPQRILGVGWRQALDLPDGAIANNLENRIAIARILRQLRPRVVILPYWQARHPDHAITATLGAEACFLSGLKKIDTGAEPHRPFKIVYASLYADVRPTFIVDITPFIEQRHLALMAYRSQYANQSAGSGIFVPEEEIRERTFAEARHYGLLAGVRFGEPFVQKEVGLVDDLTLLPVQSI